MEAKELLAGMLGRTLYVVHSGPIDGVEDDGTYFLDHVRHLVEWEQQGVLFAAGPFRRDGQVTMRSMYILRADSLAHAAALAAEEPLHKHGVRGFTVDEWTLNQGRIGLSLDFSSQRGGLDGEPQSR